MINSNEIHIQRHLEFLYGKDGEQTWWKLRNLIDDFKERNPNLQAGEFELTEKDVVLITYGDQFQENNSTYLQSLQKFLDTYLEYNVNWIHILPFFPYSSDDGFSVIDYEAVDPNLGTWDDIQALANKYQLMFDAVINHISRESSWFKSFQRHEDPFKDFFIPVDPATDLSSIFRPRALPLLTPVETKNNDAHVWTTFSDDQIDLNFSNPQVLLEIINVLLFYVERGAQLIRLDAIGYIWKIIGTSSLNLPQAHSVVKIIRSVLNIAAPQVGIITETNVPHKENIKYFGDPDVSGLGNGEADKGDEAHMVYQFSLAPLTLHAFTSGDSTILSNWAENLRAPYRNSAFFNFIASHDGIGMMPAKGLLSEDDIQTLVDRTLSHGGEVSFKTNSDGSKSVYELNITLFDALNNPFDEDPETDIKRFLASQALMLSLAGVPGIYIHSLFGSRNCLSCVKKTGRARSINREKFHLQDLQRKLSDPNNVISRVFQGYNKLLKIRRDQAAFHPGALQIVLKINPHIFSLLRSDGDSKTHILCLINTSAIKQKFVIEIKKLFPGTTSHFYNLLEEESSPVVNGKFDIVLDGYDYLWLYSENPAH